FLDEPTPFLCAMGPGGWRAEGAGSGGLFGLLLPGALGAAGAEVGDGDLRVGLAVAVLDAVALAALLLEDDDLVGLHVAEHLEAGRGAVDGGGAHLHAAVAGDEEDAVHRHGVADVGVEAGHVQLLVLLDLELLPADLYDGVHGVRAWGPPRGRAGLGAAGGPAEERI